MIFIIFLRSWIPRIVCLRDFLWTHINDLELIKSSVDLIRENRDQKKHESFCRTRRCHLSCKYPISNIVKSVSQTVRKILIYGFRRLIDSVLEIHGQQMSMLLTVVVK